MSLNDSSGVRDVFGGFRPATVTTFFDTSANSTKAVVELLLLDFDRGS